MLNKQILGPTLSGCVTNFQYVKRPWLAYYNIEMSDMYASFTPLNSPVQITRVVSTISILKVRKLLPRKWHNSPLLKGQLMAELFPLCWVSLQARRVERVFGHLPSSWLPVVVSLPATSVTVGKPSLRVLLVPAPHFGG